MDSLVSRRTFLAGASACLAAAQQQTARLDRKNLLQYRDDSGAVKTARTVQDWQRRRAAVLAGMQQVMGPFPGAGKRCPLDVRTEEEIDRPSHVLRRISYAAEPGGRVPAYLLIPKRVLAEGGKAPGVMCLHPTDHKI